jgi:predicted short-subunit dehydrogenase-like oxidoreductase (DUF2520 family)
MKRAVLYLRVSTLDQTTANQERELRQVAERAGWEVVHVYKDQGMAELKKFNLEHVMPMHCSGQNFIDLAKKEIPESKAN